MIINVGNEVIAQVFRFPFYSPSVYSRPMMCPAALRTIPSMRLFGYYSKRQFKLELV